jgi:type IV secretory pathway VirB10-like protein
VLALVCCVLASDGCLFWRKKAPLPQPAPAKLELPPKQVQAPVQPPEDISIETPPVPEPKPQEPPTFPKAPPRPTRAKQVTIPPEPPPAEAQPSTPAPAPSVKTAEPLKLSPMLSENEQRELNAAIKDLIDRAERNLMAARARNLNSDQKEMVRQAEVFMTQAQSTRATDLTAARSLAERAELLSREALK